MDINKIYFNGIDVDQGKPSIPAMNVQEFDALLSQVAKLGQTKPANLSELEFRKNQKTQNQHLGVKAGINPKKLDQTGWGVIFASDADPQVEQALQPLLTLRHAQVGDKRYRLYRGADGYQVGQNDNKNKFLKRQGAGPGAADPDRVPYYLLIVGTPDKIPFEFQTELDLQYAVGRICFDTLADYTAYARSIVAAEQHNVKLPSQMTLFGVKDDNATDDAAMAVKLSADYLIEPLSRSLGETTNWQVETLLGPDATRPALLQRLGGQQMPALLFTATHGLNVAQNNTQLKQSKLQGALVCADLAGGGDPYIAGKHITQDANLLGLIAFFFACFSAGTPQEDGYNRLLRMRLGQQPGPAQTLAPQPFVSYLPQRMLSAPAGGALAVIGHIERAWPSSFLWGAMPDGTLPHQTVTFESTLKWLMEGYPVGAAVEFLNERHAELGSMLSSLLEDVQFDAPYCRADLINFWLSEHDAAGYIVIGDPAVSLSVKSAAEGAP